MSILGVNSALAGAYQYERSKEINRTQKTGTKRTGFTEQLRETGNVADRLTVGTEKEEQYMEAYLQMKYANAATAKQIYISYQSENYLIKADNQKQSLAIYNTQGECLGAFEYSDIKIVQDRETEKRFLVSRHGVMSYAPLELDDELKEAMQKVMGVDTLETEEGLRNVSDEKETENKTDIIVKPDGSRVLVVTMSVGGMETTMSIEISKPTNMQNDNLKHDNDNGGTPVPESETISN